jgi:hypothetical protein
MTGEGEEYLWWDHKVVVLNGRDVGRAMPFRGVVNTALESHKDRFRLELVTAVASEDPGTYLRDSGGVRCAACHQHLFPMLSNAILRSIAVIP